MFEHDYVSFPELTNSQLENLGLSSPHVQITEDFVARVVKVHDGDTVTLRVDFRDFDFPLRLLDIDSPELSEGGDRSRDWLKGEIEGKVVDVQIDKSNRVGKYGRLLGTILANGYDVAQTQIHLGLAVPFGEKKASEVPSFGQLMQEVEI